MDFNITETESKLSVNTQKLWMVYIHGWTSKGQDKLELKYKFIKILIQEDKNNLNFVSVEHA